MIVSILKRAPVRLHAGVLSVALALTVLLPSVGHAIVVNTLPAGVTVSPLPFAAVRSSDDSNTDIGSQNPANVEAKLETAAWFNQPLTFVGGGACGVSPAVDNGCSAFDLGGGNSNKGGTSTFEANVFGIHYGNNFIAVLYSDLVSGFEINGLRNDVSNIYAFTTVTAVPLPAAVWLFGTAILALLGVTRRRRIYVA